MFLNVDSLHDLVEECLGSGGVGLSLLSNLLDLLSTDSSLFSEGLVVWVEEVHLGSVSEWVLLLSGVEDLGRSLVSEDALDLVRVDDLSDVWVRKDLTTEKVILSDGAGTSDGTELLFELSEGTFGEDEKSAELSSWGEGSDVESVDVEDVDTLDVSDGTDQSFGFVGDDEEWTSSLLESVVSHFASAGSEGLSFDDTFDIIVETEGLQESDGFLSLRDLIDTIIPDKRELRDLTDSVTSGGNKSEDGRSGKSRGECVSSLSEVDLSVPPSPCVEWERHSSFSAHVTEGGLTTSGSTGTSDSWDTSDGTTGSP